MPSSYSLSRNKSEGQIIRGCEVEETEKDDEETGYLSDICDYNLQKEPPSPEEKEGEIVHGKLSLPISSDTDTSSLIKVRGGFNPACTLEVNRVSPRIKPVSPQLESSLFDRRMKIIKKRASFFEQCKSNQLALENSSNPTETVKITWREFEKSAINNPAFLPRSKSSSLEPKFSNSNPFQTEPAGGGTPCDYDYDESSVQTGVLQIAKPGIKIKNSEEEDSQLSRQSSVEDSKADYFEISIILEDP